MHIKYRQQTALLYRTHWVRKGEAGNTHGFSRATFVGSLPRDAQAIPDALAAKLSTEEQALVEQRVCEPARERTRLEQQRQQQRALDPNWRLRDALGLIEAAIPLGAAQAVAPEVLQALHAALVRLPTQGDSEQPVAPETIRQDPLGHALAALEQAAAAVRDGVYGPAPKTHARGTAVYRLWEQLQQALQGDTAQSLLRALQQQGYVKRKRQEGAVG